MKRAMGAMLLTAFAMLMEHFGASPVITTFLACQAALCIWSENKGE